MTDAQAAESLSCVARDFPAPRAPVGPVLSWASFLPSAQPRLRSVLDLGPAVGLTGARAGIAHALRAQGIGPGHDVLIPAYHCIAMVEPVTFCGATPVFYRIENDTRADLGELSAKCSSRTRALIAAHYFGFPQDGRALRSFCDQHGLMFIEDCAHAFFGEFDGGPPGGHGDYAVASTMKFFPIYDGGVLVSARHSLDAIPTRSSDLRFQLKSAINILEQAADAGRLRPLSAPLRVLSRIKDRALRAQKDRTPGDAPTPVAADGAYGFDPEAIDTRMSLASRLLAATVSTRRIIARRRRNYRYLLDAMEALPGVTPLFPGLPDGVVPYMFPVRLRNPDRVYFGLKRDAVPVLRFSEDHWPGVDASVCPVAASLAKEVVQFPCHQEMRLSELDWIVSRLRSMLATR
jgi:dTDP-4-amino-4,6-dideoxygalactose transaminase